MAGKTVQIEPFRNKPDINNKKDYVKTVEINKISKPKIVEFLTAKLWFQAQCDDCDKNEQKKEFLKGDEFILETPNIIYIYHDGTISKINLDKLKFIRYVYVASDGVKHDLGKYKIFEAQKWLDGTRYRSKTLKGGTWVKKVISGNIRYYKKDGDNKTQLITPFSGMPNKVFKYKNGNLDFALYEDTSREYFNPIAFATIIGALAEVNFTDIVSNGSVGIDGTGAYSVSHFNGINMDFKYLRKDKKKGNIDKLNNGKNINPVMSNDNRLDIIRQNQFLDALYKFGWGRTTKNLSNKTYLGKMLNHCKADKNHWNHLHIQGFKPNYKK